MAGTEWKGENPCCLIIQGDDELPVITIDLDEPGWATTYADLMRRPGWWYLCVKEDSHIPIAIRVDEGEQPYYTARHIGIGTGVPGPDGRIPVTETVAYGLGKKRRDGHVDRLWWFRNGLVVGGDDAERFGIRFIKEGQA